MVTLQKVKLRILQTIQKNIHLYQEFFTSLMVKRHHQSDKEVKDVKYRKNILSSNLTLLHTKQTLTLSFMNSSENFMGIYLILSA